MFYVSDWTPMAWTPKWYHYNSRPPLRSRKNERRILRNVSGDMIRNQKEFLAWWQFAPSCPIRYPETDGA